MDLISGKIDDINWHHYVDLIESVYAPFDGAKSFMQKINYAKAKSYFLVRRNDIPVAGLVQYENNDIVIDSSSPFLFGNFEALNDLEAVKYLFEEIGNKIQNNLMLGPISGSTWYDYRLALPSANPVFFTEFFHPSYYYDLLVNIGFQVHQSYTSTISRSYEVNEKKLERCKKLLEEKGLLIRTLNMNEFEKDLRLIGDVSLKGFRNNYLYSPISIDEFVSKYLPLQKIVDPRTVFLIMEGEKCVGFSMSLPNLLNSKEKQLVMKSAARLPDYKYNGLGTCFNEFTKAAAKEIGYTQLIQAFIISDSVSEKTFAASNNAELYRNYVLLMKVVKHA